MPPPPPPFGRARKRATHPLDPALGDADLIAARAALTQGRWTAVRELLAHTGTDWDLRGHRLTVLAAGGGGGGWGVVWGGGARAPPARPPPPRAARAA
ncbi:hypothetical protein ACFV3O_16915, partial [Streptomyces albidoflavus]